MVNRRVGGKGIGMRSNPWLRSPTVRASVVGAAAALGVAAATFISATVTSCSERASDAEKAQMTMLLEIVKLPEAQRPGAATQLLRSGLLKDPKGEICKAFLMNPATECPIKPEKAN
jgi:hypothetical protein